MLKPFILALIILFALPAYAAKGKAPHPAIRMHIDEARAMCEPDFGTFKFNREEYLKTIDLNGDGREDYVLSTAGFECSGAASLYGGSGGSPHYMIISQPGGHGSLYATDPTSVLAYGFSFDEKTTPPQVLFDARCPNGKDGTVTGTTHWQWNNKEQKMTMVSLGEGCNG